MRVVIYITIVIITIILFLCYLGQAPVMRLVIIMILLCDIKSHNQQSDSTGHVMFSNNLVSSPM